MTKVLVTGGAGFIGSHMVDRLLEEGHDVTVIDNLSSGYLSNLNQQRDNPHLCFIESDLQNIASLTKAMLGCGTIFHTAAHADVRSGASNTRIDLENGTIGTYNVLEAMRLSGIRQIVHASSASIYGETPPVPMSEDHGPLLPISLYGAAKVAAEALISAYCHTFDMQCWLFRFANIIGARRRQGVVFDFVQRLRQKPGELVVLGDGRQCKPFLHVSECVDGILFGYRHANERVNLFNIGVDSTSNVRTIAAIVLDEMGLRDTKVTYGREDRGWVGDAPQLRFNMARMKRLGWEAKLSSDDAVRRAVREHLKEAQ